LASGNTNKKPDGTAIKLPQQNIDVYLTMLLRNILITLKDFETNAPRARTFKITAPDKCRHLGEFFDNEKDATPLAQPDAKVFKKR